MAKAYNKKRNTYFLYEALVSGYAAKQLERAGAGEEEFVSLTRKFFEPENPLQKDRLLYETVLDLRDKSFSREDRVYVLRDCKAKRNAMNPGDLFSEQTKVLKGLCEAFGDEALSFEVEEYKLLANIKQYFDGSDPIESIRFEKAICEDLELETEQDGVGGTEDESIGEDEVSLGEQKTLATLYETKNPGFVLFLRDEMKRVRPILQEASICPQCDVCDLEMKGKVVQVLHMVEDLKKRPFIKEDVRFFLKVQALAKELQEA